MIYMELQFKKNEVTESLAILQRFRNMDICGLLKGGEVVIEQIVMPKIGSEGQ
jgi:hypothetical protein